MNELIKCLEENSNLENNIERLRDCVNNACELCKPYGLEKGDSLYQRCYPDLDFHEIFNTQFCPLCGKELKDDNI